MFPENKPYQNSAPAEFGRVLRANTMGFAIGCRVQQLSEPSFGALVMAQPVDSREAVYGLIYDMHIDDDPLIRRLVMAEDPRPSVIEDQRNNRLLPIEMSVLTVGYQLNGELRYGLPPRPPLNLDPVFLCSGKEAMTRFTRHHGYLRLILRAVDVVPVDQLLVAHLRQAHECRGYDDEWLLRSVEELVHLLRSNYELLVPTLEAISDALPEIRESAGLEDLFAR